MKMQTTIKKTSDGKLKNKEKIKEDTPALLKNDEKPKKTVSNVSTPRNFVQKSTTADIYTQKKNNALQSPRAPKKVTSSSYATSNVSPMKDFLKSSPSTSQVSSKTVYDKTPKQKNLQARTSLHSARKLEVKTSLHSVGKNVKQSTSLPFVNVTVNSPIAKRKLNMNKEAVNALNNSDSKEIITKSFKKGESKEVEAKSFNKRTSKEVESRSLERGDSNEVDKVRQRTKTRTLNEDEVKVLTPDVVDNNAEMLNLSRKLGAKPKAFYVGLDGDQSLSKKDKSSDEEVSYEDDFEAYESDFDSYHSEPTQSEQGSDEEESSEKEENGDQTDVEEGTSKESKDEEKMLDSGNFDLRESQRSAQKTKPAVMEFILEDSEEAGEDKKSSLTDEGFQEMSSSSAVCSIRTMQVDVLDRPLFMDFSKSKESKRKRRTCENLKQRAIDLLSMITLHQMSYSMFEMKPIPYDLYMATFGRSNYTQIAVQTFDDGITEEIQTEEIVLDHKWTQYPVEFSNHDIYLNTESVPRKFGHNDEDYLTKFTFLVNKNTDEEINSKINVDKNYKLNALRIYFEQKDGVGSCEMLPYNNYKSKLKNNDFNVVKLSKFLKKIESRVSNILSANMSSKNLTALTKTTKIPFSKGFISISPKNISDEQFSFVKKAKISHLVFSETKSHLILTIHNKSSDSGAKEKCIICLWDISVARKEPVKVLVAIDNITIGRFRGGTDGSFVAALKDGTIHLWDLSEEATWREDMASEKKSTDLVEIDIDRMTQTEIDREWNMKNSGVGLDKTPIQCALQACAYTSSAANLRGNEVIDYIVGLEFVGDPHTVVSQDGGRKIIGQVSSLQRIGILTIWSLVQEKSRNTSTDLGKAYWSKMKLEKIQTILLIDHVDGPSNEIITENMSFPSFNLNAAKRRLSNRKQEKILIRKGSSRPKSAISADFDIDRPASATSLKSKIMLQAENDLPQNWESGIVCHDLKIMRVNKLENYMIAKNCGEVLCCKRSAGAIKINRFCVATDTSSVTCLEVSPHGLPYFLAATDSGTVNLCSVLDSRVLLTLDCRNGPSNNAMSDKCHSDNKGRYISSAAARSPVDSSGVRIASKCFDFFLTGGVRGQITISSIHWSPTNPCCIFAALPDDVIVWELTHSDICARTVCEHTTACAAGGATLALLTSEGEVQVHRLTHEQQNTHYLDLFQKYVALL